MDLAHEDFGPLGRIRSSLMGDGPQGRGDLALRSFFAPRGGPGMDLAHRGFWPSGEDSVLALGGWPSGEAHCQYSPA